MKAMKSLLFAAVLVLGLGTASAFAQQAATDDTAISANVQKAIDGDSVLSGSHIVVTSKDGTVVLSGDVTDDVQFGEAYRIAHSIAGVQGVKDRMTQLNTTSA